MNSDPVSLSRAMLDHTFMAKKRGRIMRPFFMFKNSTVYLDNVPSE